MKDQTPDDIFALYSHFDLDGENYRVFTKNTPVMVQTAPLAAEPHVTAPAEPAQAQPDQSPNEATSYPARTVAPPITVAESASAQARQPDIAPPELSNSESSPMALRNLWRHVEAPAVLDNAVACEALASSSISIQSVAGGVGSTTVAAILARLLARSGRRCAIFDESEISTLPVFFGGQRVAADHRRFAGLYSIFQPSVRILNREMFEPSQLRGLPIKRSSNETSVTLPGISTTSSSTNQFAISIAPGPA